MRILPHSDAGLYLNPAFARDEPYDRESRPEILSRAALARARSEIETWPDYAKTPLRSFSGLAGAAGLGAIYYKDEASRFGLGSFKALGGAYAVLRLLQRQIAARTGSEPGSSEILAHHHDDIVSAITVIAATDGNHGRSVAWGAQTFGCQCIIYVHETVSADRSDAIAAYGAEVRRIPGTFDDAVRQAAEDAAANGWLVVADTSYEGYTDVPRDVMQGYAVLAEEALEQLPDRPTHVFVQGGVGGVAAAICSYLWETLGTGRPQFVVCEPDTAACFYRSARAGRPTAAEGSLETIMAGLACGEVSLLAWDILASGASAFMTVRDEAAAECMRLLADGRFGDAPVVAGESAVAGLAAALLAAEDGPMRRDLGLGSDSVVLVIGTEGATDPTAYEAIVGRRASDVQMQMAD
jgi:diaminopropionate ammonia-lyase